MELALRRGNLFLVGMMGSGKSTIGRQLARALKKSFIDADTELERRTGVSIATIFEIEGEAGFRDREETMLAELCAQESIVLATGGGAVLRPANRCILRANGYVVYLHASVDTLSERTQSSRHRPLLLTADPRATLTALYLERDPLYREIADAVIDSDHTRTPDVLSLIAAALTDVPLRT
jgi:shikimate kinase